MKGRAGLMVFALLWLAAPAQAALFGDDTARRQIAEQTKRVDDLKLQTDQITARLARIEESLKVQPVLELANQMELLRAEMKTLRGQIEVLANTVDGIAKRQRDMYVDLDTRLRRFEQPGSAATPVAPQAPAAAAPGAAPAAPASPATTAPPTAGATVPGPVATAPPATAATPAAPTSTAVAGSPEEARTYDAAQNQRRIGNYQGAIVAFQAFLTQFPKSPLAHRAQYWIGDSHFNLRDFKNAIANQQKLIAAYPDSPSVPDAMLNIASSQLELGDTAAARKSMDALVARYPASDAAEKARRRLVTLK